MLAAGQIRCRATRSTSLRLRKLVLSQGTPPIRWITGAGARTLTSSSRRILARVGVWRKAQTSEDRECAGWDLRRSRARGRVRARGMSTSPDYLRRPLCSLAAEGLGSTYC